jgi:DNA (cytosine-5)-methyltransferase 1
MGYHRAGYDVVGVDNRPQPHYPFQFVQGDALAYLAAYGHLFDAIHASPPCQAHTRAKAIQGRTDHPDLIDPTRQLLLASGKPWVIENVPLAPVRRDLILCGTMFGLRAAGYNLERHRWFESGGRGGAWLSPFPPASCNHDKVAVSVFGHMIQARTGAPETKYGHTRNAAVRLGVDVGREAMGIDWMNRDELSEAIPPVYTEWIGRQMILAS